MKKEENNSSKCPICGRPTHKESKYCIFHASAEEKTEKDFKKALKEYIKKIEEENKGYNFKKFIFIGYIDFTNVVFKNEYTSFWGAIFQGDVGFPGTVFIGCSIFFESTFKGNVRFIGTDFQGYSDFRKAIFERNVNFYDATFEGDAYFKETTFKGYADFTKVNFLRLNDFIGASFEGETCFNNATLSQGEKLILKAKKGGNISFKHAFLENVFLDLDLDDVVLVDFTDALLRNTKTKKKQFENHILQEKEKEFSKAKEIYLLLKNNFHSIGRYNDESWAFKKEKDMERKSNCHFKTLHKWLWSCFLNGIFGYGEQPGKVIISAISIILIFAFLFMGSGISNVGIEQITSNNFFDCMYFSTVTFTTLGYGDFRPLEGIGRILAGSEAFIGAFMMALFVYTFAGRTGGR